tara:strand:+ start:782 stop:1138 length:357 start_codon:yes stop_codon:yes gene_type:complete
MTHTVTVIENHKGLTASKVAGEEYLVDAKINITSYTAGGEVITASSLGLSSIHAVLITGQEKGVGASGFLATIELDTSGDYASSSTFQIVATDFDGTNAAASATDDIGMVRVRVYGNL